jgi:hypothetical protein
MATFQVGAHYQLTFVGNADLHVTYEVIKRTARFVTVTDGRETVRCKVHASPISGDEECLPMGIYSLCPVLGADRQVNQPVGVHTTGCGT